MEGETEGLMGNRLMYLGISPLRFLSVLFRSELIVEPRVCERQQEQGAPYQRPAVGAEGTETRERGHGDEDVLQRHQICFLHQFLLFSSN